MATFKIVSGNPLLRPSTHHKAVFFLKDQWHFGQGDAAGWGWGFPRSSHPPLWLPPSHPIPSLLPTPASPELLPQLQCCFQRVQGSDPQQAAAVFILQIFHKD